MNEVEAAMRDGVRHAVLESLKNYLEVPRTDWLRRWPGQTVLNCSQVHWTSEVEVALTKNGNQGMWDCYNQQVQQLEDSVQLVRGKLSTLERITIGALCVIDVHARDVTKKAAEVGVDNVRHFEWISQLRYYWRNSPDEPFGADGDLFAMMVSSLRPYGYEYLGNTLRLVITPLTDKCYLTLMGALQVRAVWCRGGGGGGWHAMAVWMSTALLSIARGDGRR